MREEGMQGVEKAEHSLKKVQKKEELKKMIEEIKEWNKETTEDYYAQTGANTHKNFVRLEDMTEEQALFNFQIDIDILDAEAHLLRGILQFHGGSYLKGMFHVPMMIMMD